MSKNGRRNFVPRRGISRRLCAVWKLLGRTTGMPGISWGLPGMRMGSMKKRRKPFRNAAAAVKIPGDCMGCPVHIWFSENKRRRERRHFRLFPCERRMSLSSKEGFKILYLSGAYQALCEAYEGLEKEQKAVGKLKFYYISALYELGDYGKAYIF